MPAPSKYLNLPAWPVSFEKSLSELGKKRAHFWRARLAVEWRQWLGQAYRQHTENQRRAEVTTEKENQLTATYVFNALSKQNPFDDIDSVLDKKLSPELWFYGLCHTLWELTKTKALTNDNDSEQWLDLLDKIENFQDIEKLKPLLTDNDGTNAIREMKQFSQDFGKLSADDSDPRKKALVLAQGQHYSLLLAQRAEIEKVSGGRWSQKNQDVILTVKNQQLLAFSEDKLPGIRETWDDELDKNIFSRLLLGFWRLFEGAQAKVQRRRERQALVVSEHDQLLKKLDSGELISEAELSALQTHVKAIGGIKPVEFPDVTQVELPPRPEAKKPDQRGVPKASSPRVNGGVDTDNLETAMIVSPVPNTQAATKSNTGNHIIFKRASNPKKFAEAVQCMDNIELLLGQSNAGLESIHPKKRSWRFPTSSLSEAEFDAAMQPFKQVLDRALLDYSAMTASGIEVVIAMRASLPEGDAEAVATYVKKVQSLNTALNKARKKLLLLTHSDKWVLQEEERANEAAIKQWIDSHATLVQEKLENKTLWKGFYGVTGVCDADSEGMNSQMLADSDRLQHWLSDKSSVKVRKKRWDTLLNAMRLAVTDKGHVINAETISLMTELLRVTSPQEKQALIDSAQKTRERAAEANKKADTASADAKQARADARSAETRAESAETRAESAETQAKQAKADAKAAKDAAEDMKRMMEEFRREQRERDKMKPGGGNEEKSSSRPQGSPVAPDSPLHSPRRQEEQSAAKAGSTVSGDGQPKLQVKARSSG